MTDQLRSDIQDLQDELNQLSHVNPGVDLSAAIAKARALEQSVGASDQPSDPAAPSDPAPTDPTQPAPAPDEPVDQPPANPSQPGSDPSQPNPPAV